MSDENHYFSVAYSLNINVSVQPEGATLPDHEQFLREIPASFKLAEPQSQLPEINSALQSLGDAGAALQRYLKHQSDKINTLLSYVLSLQDDADTRVKTTHFGGSELAFPWPEQIAEGQLLQLKIFLPEEATAIYCYGRVIRCSTEEPFNIECEYALIRDEDREALVRASLHVQSKLLQARAEARRAHDNK